jgi:2-oxoisovalerate dehydrogenase E1 component alpha subunit
MSLVAEFKIEYSRFLGPDGKAVGALPEFARDPRALIPHYVAMLETRAFDAKAIALQRTGQLGTYASSLGQEAIGVGIGSAMREDDVLVPSYREYGAQFWRGVQMREVFLYWSGDERSGNYERQKIDFPMCVTVGAHAGHAVGAGYAMKLEGKGRAVVCTMGDGATSKGDFYEAINAAGTWKLPIVFAVANNQFAISVRRARQTAARTLAQKAIAAGIHGEQIDGNDVIAVRHATEAALSRARSGDGPGLVEMLTYRMSDHTTADDASRYRTEEEVRAHWKEDPIARLRTWLVAAGAWNKEDEEIALKKCADKARAEAEAYLAVSPQSGAAMFEFLYEKLPATLAAQREEAESLCSTCTTHHG